MSDPTPHTKRRLPVPIRAKLFAALVLPLAAVAGLCWVQVSQARDRVTDVEAETALARTALAPGGLVDALIVEQADATVSPLGLRGTAQMTFATWEETTAATDEAIESFRTGLPAGGPVAEKLFGPVVEQVEADLEVQRAAFAGMIDTPGLINLVPVLDEVYPAYSATITQLLVANEQLAEAISNPLMRNAAHTLNDVNTVHFDMSRLMSAVGTGLLRPGNEGRDPVVRYLDLYEDAVNDLRGQTDGPWAPAVEAFAASDAYQAIIDRSYDYLDTNEIDLDSFISLPPAYAVGSEPPPGSTQNVARTANRHLAAIIDDQLADARDEQDRYTYLAVGILVIAAAAALLVARSIIRPMRKLTNQAEEMAAVALPQAVKGILDTPAHQDVVIPELAPISVQSRDELQTVATAINHVQSSALGLAAEQATLRRNIADSFVSLGRRTQNLIGLQLGLITELEEGETDPATLESLYRLDHLATRARRNAESLVVLGGTDSHRTGGAPVAMTDVVRASLSEVEAYQRVALTDVDAGYVPASSAADLIHLLAELTENGLSFSPPDTNVEVTGNREAGGYTITVVDHGVGMTADKVAQANRRLADNESFTVAPSRYLGHYVTGKLAARIGAKVSLATGADGGVTATIFVPAASLVSDEEAGRVLARTAPADAETDSADTTGATAAPANANGTSGDGPTGPPRVDGRPPVVVDHNGTTSVTTAARVPVTVGADHDAVPSPDEPEPVPVAETAGGLRKRVPGAHVKEMAERSPLLRSAAASQQSKKQSAETAALEAQKLANLLPAYTSGIDRGRKELSDTEPVTDQV